MSGDNDIKRERDLDYAVQGTLWDAGFGDETATREENALAFAESMRASHAVIQEVIDHSDKSGAWYIAHAFREKSRADAAVAELELYKNRRVAVMALHHRHVTSGLCVECGKPAPCPTVVAQVVQDSAGRDVLNVPLPDERT